MDISRSQNHISCPEDRRWLASIMARLCSLNTYSWNVQRFGKVMVNTTHPTLFETIPEACLIEFLREGGLFYLIWMVTCPGQLLIWIGHQVMAFSTWINPHILTQPPNFVYRAWWAMREPYLWRTTNMFWRMCDVVKQMQSNPNPHLLFLWNSKRDSGTNETAEFCLTIAFFTSLRHYSLVDGNGWHYASMQMALAYCWETAR